MKNFYSSQAWLRQCLLTAALLVGLSYVHFAAAAELTREEMEAQVKGMLQSWETGDADKFAAAFGEQLVYAYPGDRLNKELLIAMFKSYHQHKKDIKIYFDRFLVSGGRFAMTYQFAATDRKSGARQAVGTAASGRIEDGKIVLYKEFYDEHVAKRQATHEIPLDEGHFTAYPYSLMLDPKLIN